MGLAARTWASTILPFQAALPDATFVNGDDLLNGLRRIKDADEIDALHRGSQIADAVMEELVSHVAEGVTELELASEVDFQLRRLGARTPSFDTGAFAMGRNIDGRDASIRVSARSLAPGDAVSFDFGHCIGLDTHERPFLSIEDRTVLEPGMVFTIEPSIFWPGHVGVRVEDLLVLEEHGCRNLNGFHHDLLAVGV